MFAPGNIDTSSLVVVAAVVAALVAVGFLFVKIENVVAEDDRAFAAGPMVLVTVLACRSNGGVRDGAKEVVVRCDLEVTLSGDSDYRKAGVSMWRFSSHAVDVPLHALGSFRTGVKLRARMHATDPHQLRFIWDDLVR